MAPHSSTLAWKIPWTEEPGRLQSMGLLRVRHDWATSLSLFTFLHWRRQWQPTPVFLPGESQGWGAWWAAVHGVAQSRTGLTRLSSSSSSSIESKYRGNQVTDNPDQDLPGSQKKDSTGWSAQSTDWQRMPHLELGPQGRLSPFRAWSSSGLSVSWLLLNHLASAGLLEPLFIPSLGLTGEGVLFLASPSQFSCSFQKVKWSCLGAAAVSVCFSCQVKAGMRPTPPRPVSLTLKWRDLV